jgi:hypothetical protein
MKPDDSVNSKRQAWVAPTVTKLAIGTATKAPVGAGEKTEPQAPTTPATKFGFSLEWSFPLSAKTD